LTGANKVSMGNRFRSVSTAPRSVFDCISHSRLDLQKDHVHRDHSSVFDHLEWPNWDDQGVSVPEVDLSALDLNHGFSSRSASRPQNLKGKEPVHSAVSGCPDLW
jgi:hypothetical protein